MGHLVVGRDSAIAVLYRRYAARLADMAEPIVGRASAEDIARDVMLTVWSAAATFDPSHGPFEPWVMHITRRRILDALRTPQTTQR